MRDQDVDGAVELTGRTNTEKLFKPGDLVQLKSATGSGFPCLVVAEVFPVPREDFIGVKATYYNAVDGDFKTVANPQDCFVAYSPIM